MGQIIQPGSWNRRERSWPPLSINIVISPVDTYPHFLNTDHELSGLKWNISKIYPGVIALNDFNLKINVGEVHGMVGKNGAGKSTLVNIIAGLEEPSKGEFIINNEKIKGFSRMIARKHKVSIVTQEPQIIPDFTVAENLFLPDYNKSIAINWNSIYTKAEELLKKIKIPINVYVKAGELSVSEQQLLLVAKECYIEDSDVIIFDEVTASLSQNDEIILKEIIKDRKENGKSIIIISHRIDEILNLCDRVTVIRDGEKIDTISCENLEKEKLCSLIVGKEFSYENIISGNFSEKSVAKSKEVLLKVDNLNLVNVFKDISFSLYKGEILGIAGLRGSGRTEILKSIAGLLQHDSGEIFFQDKALKGSDAVGTFKKGIIYLPEDRITEGLFNEMTLKFNLVLNAFGGKNSFFIRNEWEEQLCDKVIKRFDIIASSTEQYANQLSGGNKQKTIIGRVTAADPKIFLLDEPTRGIDVEAKSAILKIIKNELSQNTGVIITDPGIEDIISVCDRILILYNGSIIKEFVKEEFSEDMMYYYIQGGKAN